MTRNFQQGNNRQPWYDPNLQRNDRPLQSQFSVNIVPRETQTQPIDWNEILGTATPVIGSNPRNISGTQIVRHSIPARQGNFTIAAGASPIDSWLTTATATTATTAITATEIQANNEAWFRHLDALTPRVVLDEIFDQNFNLDPWTNNTFQPVYPTIRPNRRPFPNIPGSEAARALSGVQHGLRNSRALIRLHSKFYEVVRSKLPYAGRVYSYYLTTDYKQVSTGYWCVHEIPILRINYNTGYIEQINLPEESKCNKVCPADVFYNRCRFLWRIFKIGAVRHKNITKVTIKDLSLTPVWDNINLSKGSSLVLPRINTLQLLNPVLNWRDLALQEEIGV